MKPYYHGPGGGDAVWMFDALDTIKADAATTGGSFSLFELQDSNGSTVPLHVNDRWDRGFYVLEGEYTFVLGDESVAASRGTWVFAPRGTPLAWRCDSAEGRVLNVTVPGGFEGFYREVGQSVADRTRVPARMEPDVEALSTAASRHGISIIGPPPGA
jgi:quercetin dioxygenase-like cupin family protein